MAAHIKWPNCLRSNRERNTKRQHIIIIIIAKQWNGMERMTQTTTLTEWIGPNGERFPVAARAIQYTRIVDNGGYIITTSECVHYT